MDKAFRINHEMKNLRIQHVMGKDLDMHHVQLKSMQGMNEIKVYGIHHWSHYQC